MLPASDEPTNSPGAAISGLIRPSRVGPRPEKPDRLPTPPAVESPAIVWVPCTLIQRSLSAYEPAVMSWRAVPGTPALLAVVNVARCTSDVLPASASFQRSNDGAEDNRVLVVTRIVQMPLSGGTTGAHRLLSQIWTNTSLSAFTGSGAFDASTCTAPWLVHTTPESTPRAAPTVTAGVGVTISTVTASGPSYQRSSQTWSLSEPVFGVYVRLKVLLVDAATAGSAAFQSPSRAPEFPAAIAIAAPRVAGPTAASIVNSSGSVPSWDPRSLPRLMLPTHGLPAAAAVWAMNCTADVRSQASQKMPALSNTRTTSRSASAATPANVPAGTPLPVSSPFPAAEPATCVPWPWPSPVSSVPPEAIAASMSDFE